MPIQVTREWRECRSDCPAREGARAIPVRLRCQQEAVASLPPDTHPLTALPRPPPPPPPPLALSPQTGDKLKRQLPRLCSGRCGARPVNHTRRFDTCHCFVSPADKSCGSHRNFRYVKPLIVTADFTIIGSLARCSAVLSDCFVKHGFSNFFKHFTP